MNDRAALVTGGASGIGLAIAEMLVADGFDLTLVGRDGARLGAAAERLGGHGADVIGVVADVADEAAVAASVREHERHHGRLDVLVNNAGVLAVGPLERIGLPQLDAVLDVDLRAVILYSRAALPALRTAGARHGQAVVVNIASISGKRTDPGFAVYCAAKFGVVGFTSALAKEVADAGVGACAVCPGLVDTGMADWARGWAGGRMLSPADVAERIRPLVRCNAHDVPHELVIDKTAVEW
jgi:ketoreductase